MKRVDITLDDHRKPENQMFANIVDPINLSIFVNRVTDTEEKRSLEELVEALLAGK